MRKLDKNSRRGVINLFADFILSKIDKNENSIIKVIDCESFMVIRGETTSEVVLDIDKIKNDFTNWFGDLLKSAGIDKINTLDVIKYGSDLKPINEGWVDVSKDVFTEQPEPLFELSICSEFPYGYSLSCGRLMNYYTHYMFNNMYSTLNIDKAKFFFTQGLNENEDFDIDIVSDSWVDKDDVKSLILDVFDFDLDSFKETVIDYNITQDILFPSNVKPYTRQDRLKDVLLF